MSRETLSQYDAEELAAWSTMRTDRRFLWFWLSVATALSVAGNVGHAWLALPTGVSRWMAIGWAVAPPALLMLAIHGLPTLARMLDRAARDKVLTAVVWGVTVGAFGWSAFGIFGFTSQMGIPAQMAWVAPLVIDLSVFGATRGLVLTAPVAARMKAGIPAVPHVVESNDASIPDVRDDTAAGDQLDEVASVQITVDRPAILPSPASVESAERPAGPAHAELDAPAAVAVPAQRSAEERSLSSVPDTRMQRPAPSEDDRHDGDAVRADRWQPVAQSMVREGVTSKDPDLVAKILAENEAGTPPSTIGRRHEVHHTTVTRILSAAGQFAEASAG